MIKSQIATALNKQIQHEQSNAHAYQAVSLYFEALNLHGIAAFMAKQVEDERTHAAKFIEHMVNRNAKVELSSLPAPKNEFGNPLEAVKHVLELERLTTSMINKLYDLAIKENDPALKVLLHWFVNEQVEEEKWAEELTMLAEQFHKNPGQMFMLDHQWGKRVKEG